MNRPTAIKELGATALATYAYDDLSRRTTVSLSNGTTTTYGYTPQGALASLAHNLAGTAQDLTYTYTRNQAQEITAHGWNNDLYQWAGYAPGTKSYTSDGLNRYTNAAGAAIGYDSNGNLTGDGTWTYTFDADNKLKTAAKTGYSATLAYDPEGRLRQTTLAGVTTQLLYDGTDLVAEYDGAGALLRRYVHGPGIDEPLVWYEGAGTTSKTWLHADHLGSIVATADGAGTSTAIHSYGPYGEPNVATGIRFRYTGQQFLGDLNLYYYKARFYSPALGRFLQTDPIGTKDDLNLYAYVGNNPINFADPTGLSAAEGKVIMETVSDAARAALNFAGEMIHKGLENAANSPLNIPITDVNGNVVAHLAIGPAGTAGSFVGSARILFKTTHYGSRLEAAGLNVARVEAAVATEVAAMRSSMTAGADVVGRTRVDGVLIEYRSRLLSNGSVNVGTIFPVR